MNIKKLLKIFKTNWEKYKKRLMRENDSWKNKLVFYQKYDSQFYGSMHRWFFFILFGESLYQMDNPMKTTDL